ncbi:MAG TPA: alpha-L-fucosidase [Candidatus Angelobacter sp.]|nr:alpha-L-fucosidase [Candidatus Angelobacter sp.]
MLAPTSVRRLPLQLLAAFLLTASLSTTTFSAETNSPVAHEYFGLPSKDSPETAWWRESMKTKDQRLAWWREARFGMFIHWGVYSGLGNEFRGRKGGGYAEHIQRVLKIPIPVYRKEVAGTFDPTNFNAEAWVRLAKQAGMQYIVITAKHHDGFAMWPTKVNDYNIMDATPWKHDPMKDLKAACKKYGIHFGFYYSQAFDWGDQDAPGNDWDFDNPGGDKLLGGKKWWETRPQFMAHARKYVDEKAIPQLRELIKMYDPDILWFDTSSKLPPSENLRIMKAVREASPRVVISGRLVGHWGDYDDTTDRPAEFPPHDGDWEAIPTTDESYGWNKFDTAYKPPSHFIQLLAKAAARGGNVLMNIGPRGDGTIDPRDVAILKGIGDWWQLNGESIRGTTRTPLPVQTWGESTVKGDTVYLHVFDWPTNGQLIVGGLKSELQPHYTATPQAEERDMDIIVPPSFPVKRLNPLDVGITVPSAPLDKVDSVIALRCKGEIVGDSTRLLQPSFPVETLRAFDGELHGGLRFGPGKKTDDVVMNWTKTNQYINWPVRVNSYTVYEVTVNYDADEQSAGNTFTVTFELPEKYKHTMPPPSVTAAVKPGKQQSEVVGELPCLYGGEPFEIKINAKEIKGGELFRLRKIELRPVQVSQASSSGR